MLLERAELAIREGAEEAFAADMAARGIPLLLATPGVLSVRMGRGVENPTNFLLLVEWTSMAAHAEFSGTPANTELRAVIAPHSCGGRMEHFRMA